MSPPHSVSRVIPTLIQNVSKKMALPPSTTLSAPLALLAQVSSSSSSNNNNDPGGYRCWFCGHLNPSHGGVRVCALCRGLAVPGQRWQANIETKVMTFDPHATTFNSVHASLLFSSIKALDDQDKAAIKVGVRSSCTTDGEYPAVMIAKTPGYGKLFTVCGPKRNAARQRAPMLNTERLHDGIGADHVFWESLNQVLDLDTHFPVRQESPFQFS